MGRPKGEGGRSKGQKNHSPRSYMNALVPVEVIEGEPVAGKDMNFEYVDPVQFCLAVINHDMAILKRCGVEKEPTMSQKIAVANICIPYTNKKQPVDINQTHQFMWSDKVSKAEERLQKMRQAYEPAEQPDAVH